MITVMTLDKLTVNTTAGEKFTGRSAARLAALIYRLHGRNLADAASAWRVLNVNDTPDSDMRELVRIGLALERLDALEYSPTMLGDPLARLIELVEKQTVEGQTLADMKRGGAS